MTTTHDVLNDAQQRAVKLPGGALMILAGPGSGKTRVIAHRIAYLVENFNVPPWRILAVTFTNKAAREMRERVEGLLGPRAHDLSMGTFHSICARILRRDGPEIGLPTDFVIYDTNDQSAVIRAIQSEQKIDPKRFPPRQILSAISSAKNERIDANAYQRAVGSYFEEIVSRAYTRYQDALSRSGAVDFDDLLGHTLHLFEARDAVHQRYADRYLHTLVDEFQDTNLVQYQLARLFASVHGNITAVGDPDQSIYSWRAADIRNIQHFQRDFPGSEVILLEQNYRSTGHILSAAHAVIDRADGRPQKHLWTENPAGDKVIEYEAPYGEEEGAFIGNEIRRLMRTADYQHSDFAVMYRTNAQSRAIEEAFIQQGIRYRLVGGTRFYDRREVRDLIAYLRLIQNEYDTVAFQRIINVPGRGIGQKSTGDLLRAAAELGISPVAAGTRTAKGDPGLPTFRANILNAVGGFVTLIDQLAADCERLTVAELLDRILAAINYRAHLEVSDREHAAVRWENVQELRSVAAQYQDAAQDADRDSSLATFLEEVALVSDIDDRSDDEPDAVTLITLHSAKGLEYPVVFLPGMEEGLLPHFRSIDDPTQLEEERRVCYVGMTRAQQRLYLTRARRRFLFGNLHANPPSRFLGDLPEADVEVPVGAGSRPATSGSRGLRAAAAARQAEQAQMDQSATPAFAPGDRVVHTIFGAGIVIDCELVPGDQQVTVAFEGQGVKKLMRSFAPLTPADA
jgi:DNA helicase-2/ATP-dependent DNA helicase PcrA